jgi:hypothetical protein
MAPSVVVFGRCVLGALFLVPLAARSRALAGLRRNIVPIIAVACLDMALPTFLTAWGRNGSVRRRATAGKAPRWPDGCIAAHPMGSVGSEKKSATARSRDEGRQIMLGRCAPTPGSMSTRVFPPGWPAAARSGTAAGRSGAHKWGCRRAEARRQPGLLI